MVIMESMKENKMGVMPIGKLIFNMSTPMVISMLVQALYNIVDSVFVSHVSEDALTALSMAFPLQALTIAVAGGTGVGINAILSRALGAKEYDKVNKTATNGVFLALLSFLVFMLIGFFAVEPFYRSQTKDIAVIQYGCDYLSIVMIASIGLFSQMTFERLLQSTGKTFYTMIIQGTGAIINIILDPILIFGFLGAPRMGTAGAALATVIGQIVAGTIAVIMNIKCNKEIKLHVIGFRPNGKIISEIYMIGIPSIIMQAIGSVMTYSMNKILMGFEKTAVTVFGAYFKIQSFIFMPLFGINNGIVPIIAYNYGAGKRNRVIKTIKLTTICFVVIMLIGFLCFQFAPKLLLGMFNPSPTMTAIGMKAFRIISIHFLLAGFCIAMSSAFQALGKAVYGMVISIMRQLVVLIPAAYLLSLTGEVNNVWWSFPIAECASLTISTIFFVKLYKNVIRKIPE